MIFCNRAELSHYRGLHQNLDRALDAVAELRPETLPEGKTVIDGERVFINRFHYETGDKAQALFETHFRYADIHLLISGREEIAIADASLHTETERDEAQDYQGTRGDAQCVCRLMAKQALLVFPGEAHRSGQAVEQSETVHKLVVKVWME